MNIRTIADRVRELAVAVDTARTEHEPMSVRSKWAFEHVAALLRTAEFLLGCIHLGDYK